MFYPKQDCNLPKNVTIKGQQKRYFVKNMDPRVCVLAKMATLRPCCCWFVFLLLKNQYIGPNINTIRSKQPMQNTSS